MCSACEPKMVPVMYSVAIEIDVFPTSSTKTQRSRTEPSEPPYSTGTGMPVQPRAAHSR